MSEGALARRAALGTEQLALAEQAIASSAHAVLAVDSRGRVLLANGKAAELLGYSPGELVGIQLEALIPARFWSEHRRHRARYLEQPCVRTTGRKVSAARKDGTEIAVELILSPFETEQGVVVLTILRERGDCETAEQALALAEQALPGRQQQESARAERPDLSGRELEVLQLAANGRTNKEIGADLRISPHTVQKHFTSLFLKLGTSSRSEACARAIREGLID